MAHFSIPDHIIVGCGAIKEALPYLEQYGHHVFIVTGKHVGKSPMLEQLLTAMKSIRTQFCLVDSMITSLFKPFLQEGKKKWMILRF